MSLVCMDINQLHVSMQISMYIAVTHVHNILIEHLVSLRMVTGSAGIPEWSIAVLSFLGCGGTIIALLGKP